ncbi:MAG: alpha-ketoacid dehydrogenase subunit beta [Candidatus Omnitrophica bacterium]|nr:alpha-ketoacid dehydrogenase subunit beta [Candidatus Omnitrophota bacterium]
MIRRYIKVSTNKNVRQITYCQAINEALTQLMERHKNIFIMGLGVDDPKRIFGSTTGLSERFGKRRVFEIPISENAVTGAAIGASLCGMRPIMTHQRMDFMFYAFDQIINHAAKWRYMFGGVFSVPITIRSIIGRGWGQGSQHSQSLQSLFAHIPGLKVVMPSTPYDVKGLLISSVLDNNPVIFIEHRRLYDEIGMVPKRFYRIPLGKAKVLKKGKDLTIVATSQMVMEAEKASQKLLKCKIDAEVIDLRTIKPLDEDIIFSSVKKTGRLIVADAGWKNCGISSEVASRVAENVFRYLKSPVERITFADTPAPASAALEKVFYPDCEDMVYAAKKLISGKKIKRRKIEKSIVDEKFTGPF